MVWYLGGGLGGGVCRMGRVCVVGIGGGGSIVVLSDQQGGFEYACLDCLELYVIGVRCAESFVGGEKGGV